MSEWLGGKADAREGDCVWSGGRQGGLTGWRVGGRADKREGGWMEGAGAGGPEWADW